MVVCNIGFTISFRNNRGSACLLFQIVDWLSFLLLPDNVRRKGEDGLG